jgi:hypothetical protein
MQSVVGVFGDRVAARRAAEALPGAGIDRGRITLLMPGEVGASAERVPTTEAEAPGIGRALGAVVGGAAGATGGAQLGTLVSVFVPGIGPIIALGAIGAALLGLSGAAVGGALDESLREGIPRDEVYVYEDALRRGRAVVVALAADDGQAQAARDVMKAAGAESLDAAREQWWIGLREVEAAAGPPGAVLFGGDERAYRAGFEAALGAPGRGRPYPEAADALRSRYPDLHASEAFRRGYERGLAWNAGERARRAA